MMIYALSLFLGSAGAWWMSRYAYLLGLMDKPGERSSHEIPTPKGGGIGLLLVFLMVSILYRLPLMFWLPTSGLALLSLFGDRVDLSQKLRLIVQFIAAILFLISVGFFKNADMPAVLTLPFFILFIAGTANFYNFMDGINGIAGITAIVGFGLLGAYGLLTGQESGWITLSFAILYACVGFLPFNLPRARIFMGDVGSILLGFVFASFVVFFADSLLEFLLLCSFMLPFYLDEMTSMLERLQRGQSLTKPHRSHLYQVLANEAGVAHWKVSLGYGLAQLIAGFSVWWGYTVNELLCFSFMIFYSIIFTLVNNHVKQKYLFS